MMRSKHWTTVGIITTALGAYHFANINGFIPGSVQNNLRALPGAAADYANRSGNPELGTLINTGAALVKAYESQNYPNSNFGNPGSNFTNQSGYANQTAGYGAANNGYGAAYGQAPVSGGGDIGCWFSPAGGCTDACVREIGQAQQQILVQAYSFTSAPIAQALVAARQRGVGVYIILDKSQKTEKYSSADFVAHAGIPTFIDDKHAIAHNKIMLIDNRTIITGSFNFTTNAEKSNAENLLIIRNRPDLYTAYENNFKHHYEHSQPYQGRGMTAQQSGFADQNPTSQY